MTFTVAEFKISCCCSRKYKYSHVKLLVEEVSSDWPHQKISSTDSKDRSTLIPNQKKYILQKRRRRQFISLHHRFSFVNKQGRISKSNEFAKTVDGFFLQYVLVQTAYSREVLSHAISLFEQYIIHMCVTNNVHQIIKH